MTEQSYQLHFKWTISRARDTEGYNVCTLLVDGVKVGRCNGGGYDMEGTCLGIWLESAFADKLRKLDQPHYSLTWHDPNYDPSEGIPDPKDGRTVAELEAAGESFGLERYREAYKASSKVPTERHQIPSIDGGCGFSCIERIFKEIGGRLQYLSEPSKSRNNTYYIATMPE